MTQSAGPRGGEGLLAGVAPPTGLARLGRAERREEGLAGGYAEAMAGAGLFWTASLPNAGNAVALNALQVLVNAEVALHGEQRTAQAACQMRVALFQRWKSCIGIGCS